MPYRDALSRETVHYLAWQMRRWSLLYLAFHPSRARADRVPDDVQ
jgi:hypothetical protein